MEPRGIGPALSEIEQGSRPNGRIDHLCIAFVVHWDVSENATVFQGVDDAFVLAPCCPLAALGQICGEVFSAALVDVLQIRACVCYAIGVGETVANYLVKEVDSIRVGLICRTHAVSFSVAFGQPNWLDCGYAHRVRGFMGFGERRALLSGVVPTEFGHVMGIAQAGMERPAK